MPMTLMFSTQRCLVVMVASLLFSTGMGCSENESESTAQSPSELGERGMIRFIDLRVEDISATRAVVRFDTDIPTTCEVEWGSSRDALINTAVDPSMVEGEFETDHEVPIEDLNPDTTYYLRAVAEDAQGREDVSSVISFQTLSQAATPEGTNIATLAMGSSIDEVSSNFGNAANDATWGANNGIDGSMSSEWSSNGDGNDAWISIDFGQTRKIEHFGFRSRKMTNGTAIITSVQVTFDDTTTVGPFATPSPDELYLFALSPIEARYARIEVLDSSGGNTGAKEIQFFTHTP